MAGIAQHHDTLTRSQIMRYREAEAQRLRAAWALAAEDKKRRHKEALEHARRINTNEKKDNSKVIG